MGQNLKNQIEEDFKAAIKNKDFFLISVLRLIKNAILNAKIKKQAELTDEEIITLLNSELKKLKEAKEQFEKGGRVDLVQKTEREIEIVKKYLPPEASPEEIEKVARETIKELKIKEVKEMGKAIKAIREKLKGADGQTIAQIVKKILMESNEK